MNTLTICGYEQDGICSHCGRTLKHCIIINHGAIVGAQCFNKSLTKAKTYQGKSYRVGAEKVIELAKVRQFWSASRQALAGYSPAQFVFEAA